MNKTFTDLVSYETISRETGFNYWETGLSFSKDDRVYMAYLTRDKDDSKNIVIIERLLWQETLDLLPKSKKSGKEWFFGIIEGKPLADCNKEEQREFYKKLDELATRKYRVAGSNLENLILKNL